MNAGHGDGAIHLGPGARQRFYEPQGVGHPVGDGLAVGWVEAAYLLLRGDLESVDGRGARAFLAEPPDPGAFARLAAYRDLRDRGYYLALAYPPGEPAPLGAEALSVRPRGASPTGDQVVHRMRVVTEATTLGVTDVVPGAVAIVDDETEVTYLDVGDEVPAGAQSPYAGPECRGRLVGDRVLAEDPPSALYDRSFYGTYLDEDRTDLVLNLLEARRLVDAGWLHLEPEPGEDPDRGGPLDDAASGTRARVYSTLRERGTVPRSGLKFGADFRVYEAIDSAADPGHSRYLVDVRSSGETVSIRSLSRAVRLATGVRKTHVLAVVDPEGAITWRPIERLTP